MRWMTDEPNEANDRPRSSVCALFFYSSCLLLVVIGLGSFSAKAIIVVGGVGVHASIAVVVAGDGVGVVDVVVGVGVDVILVSAWFCGGGRVIVFRIFNARTRPFRGARRVQCWSSPPLLVPHESVGLPGAQLSSHRISNHLTFASILFYLKSTPRKRSAPEIGDTFLSPG